jgi:hypothetical protein
MAKHKATASKPSAARAGIFDTLFADKRWLENYRVTPDEIESVRKIAMMGEVKCERDVLFILNQIRRARLRW